MNPAGARPPRSLRTLSAAALLVAAAAALASLPAEDLPTVWLAAFVLPATVLAIWPERGAWPWLRAAVGVLLQAGTCYLALTLVGPMSRPAALACTILPPLAFTTVRNREHDAGISLFLSFCVLLVGTILSGIDPLLLAAFCIAGMSSLRVGSAMTTWRAGTAPPGHAGVTRAALAALPSLLLGGLAAVMTIDRVLRSLPSPSVGGTTVAGQPSGGMQGLARQGLDDSFVLDGNGGLLPGLHDEQLLRVSRPDGSPVDPYLYLRCGFFADPDLDRWRIGPLRTTRAEDPDGHQFVRRSAHRTVELTLERFGGGQQFVFVPGDAVSIEGDRDFVADLAIDARREWVRGRHPVTASYVASYAQWLVGRSRRIDRSAGELGMLALPDDFDRAPFAALLRRWRIDDEPMAAMAGIAAALGRHCSYARSEPVGPYRHAIENFLFGDERRGYCMHFASAAALLLRMLDVPCRIGVGLYGGRVDPATAGARIYGSQHAHAWVEVPCEGDGFLIFDPTPPELRARPFTADAERDDGPRGESSTGPDTVSLVLQKLRQLSDRSWPWVVALCAALLLALRPPRRLPAAGRSPTTTDARARRALLQLLQALATAGHPRPPGHTLEQFGLVLAGRGALPAEVTDALLAYQEVRFGGRTFDERQRRRLELGVAAATQLPSPAQQDAAGQ